MENFPSLVRGIDIKAQEAKRVQTIWTQRGSRQDTSSKMPKIKDKERILKAAGVKQFATYMGATVRLSADLSTEIW